MFYRVTYSSLLLGVIAQLLGIPRPSQAQSLRPGDRVRVVRPADLGGPLTGQLVRSTMDSVWLRRAGEADAIGVGLGSGVRLDRSLGRRSRAGTGALIGAAVGTGVTLLFLSGFCGGDTLCNGDEQVRAALIFGLPSLAIGAGIGALIKVERWSPVSPGTVGAADRLQVGVRIAW